MTLDEARKILGLEDGERLSDRLLEIERARGEMEKLAEGVKGGEEGARFREGLEEFDVALETVKAEGEGLGLIERESQGSPLLRALVVLVVVVGLGMGAWVYLEQKREADVRLRAEISQLEAEGSALVDKRLWVEAEEVFERLARLDEDSAAVERGMESIAAGRLEEQKRYVAYWRGAADSAFEAGNWDEAEQAAGKVLEKYAEETELEQFLQQIEEARAEEKRVQELDVIRKMLAQRDFDGADAAVDSFMRKYEGDTDAESLNEEVIAAKAKAAADLERALALYEQAKAADTGEYDEEAVEWLREALVLAPGNVTISELYEKVAAYTRTVRVPEDVETLKEAMENAKTRDRIVVGPGVWEGPLVMKVSVKLEGSTGNTVVKCASDAGSALVVTFWSARGRSEWN